MSDEPNGGEDGDSLDVLNLSRLPIAHPTLRKAFIVKNGRLQNVVELYRDKSIGSGQYDVDAVAATLGIAMPNADIMLLRCIALMPVFDVFSIRLLLRDLDISEAEMASLTPGPRAAAKVEAALRRYVGPMMRAGAGLDPSAMTVDQMRAAFAGDSPEAARNLAALASKLSVSPATALRFANDYIDTFGAIALYEQSVERLMPAVVELVKEMKRLLAKPATKSNPILRTALDDIIVILPDLVTSVRKRLGSVEKIAVALWTGSGGGPFVQQAQVREFQVLIGFLLAGVSAKVTSWRIAFPAGTAVNSAKRATFFGSEMNHAMQQLRDAAQRGTRAASFPSDVLRIRDKGDNFRAFLRARQPQR